MRHILTVCLNPVIQKTMFIKSLNENNLNRSSEYYMTASGKGINVSRVLNQLGIENIHLTHSGGTLNKLFKDLCLKDKIKAKSIDSKSEIRMCSTIISTEKHTVSEFIEEAEKINSKTEKKLRNAFSSLLHKADLLVISGSKAPGYSDNIFPWMTKTAKSRNISVILDIRGADLLTSLPYSPDIIKPNKEEFLYTRTLDKKLKSMSFEESLIYTAKTYKTSIILTDNKNDVIYTEGNKIYTIPVPDVKIINTTGCGDSFTAGTADSFLEGCSLRVQVEEGLRCAALNAGTKLPGCIY